MLATIAGISMYLAWALGMSLYHKMKKKGKENA
jgi:hypothetical protein